MYTHTSRYMCINYRYLFMYISCIDEDVDLLNIELLVVTWQGLAGHLHLGIPGSLLVLHALFFLSSSVHVLSRYLDMLWWFSCSLGFCAMHMILCVQHCKAASRWSHIMQ